MQVPSGRTPADLVGRPGTVPLLDGRPLEEPGDERPIAAAIDHDVEPEGGRLLHGCDDTGAGGVDRRLGEPGEGEVDPAVDLAVEPGRPEPVFDAGVGPERKAEAAPAVFSQLAGGRSRTGVWWRDCALGESAGPFREVGPDGAGGRGGCAFGGAGRGLAVFTVAKLPHGDGQSGRRDDADDEC